MLEKLLSQLNLGNKEQIIYKLILEHGKIGPALLSRLAKINRTTVYSVAKELKDKGLIVEDLGGKTLYYIPARENELEKLVKTEHEKVEKKEKSIRDLQEFLKQMPESKTFSVPKIRFVDEADLEEYLYEAAPRWNKSLKEDAKTWWGFQDHTFVDKFEKWIDWFWKGVSEDIDLKLLTNESDIEQKMKGKEYTDRRVVKLHESSEFTATQWIVGDYVIFVMTKQRPFYLVEIHDSVIAHNMKELFRSIWNNDK
jgi:sugar-specific transcriptional regulator TrmB